MTGSDESNTAVPACPSTGIWTTHPGALIGMKPPQFAEWMFRQLGGRPGDELDDLFPGSGAVSEAWWRS